MEKVERPNTLIVTIPDEFVDLSHAAFVDKLVGSLGADGISAIQFVPSRYVRVTFSSFEARNEAFLSGITIESTRLVVVEADPVFREVYLEHLPVEVLDESIVEALGAFGSVREIVNLKHAGTEICNGTRLLKMSLASDVPVNVRILRYPCRVFYKGQPRPCPICRSPEHRAPDCPLRDVCRRCRRPGHFARDCDSYAVAVGNEESEVGDDVSGDDDDVDEDYVDSEDVDEVSGDDDVVDEEFVSGDEVINSAPAADLPPRSQSVPAPPSAPAVSSPRPSSPVRRSTPMDTGTLISATRPLWVSRVHGSHRASFSAYSPDAHVSWENYSTGGVDVVFDFGRLTCRVLKETRYLEEDRYYAYLTGAIDRPTRSSFVRPAVNIPALPSDAVPASFPSPG